MNKDAKAQSEVVGIVLLLGISLTSIGIIFLLAQPIVTEATDDATLDRVENDIVSLDTRLSAAAYGTSNNESLTLHLGDGQLSSEPDTTFVNVTLNGTSIYNGTIGKIEYTNAGESIAYEGGGVWRRNNLEGDSFMVTSPDFDFDGETLTLPIFNVTTSEITSGRQTFSIVDGNTTRVFPNASIGRTNPVVNGTVNVTVESDYYQAWGRYFEEELRGKVTLNETGKSVEAELVALENPDNITSAGVSRKDYARPANDPFDNDVKDGVRYPSVDRLIESYVEYGENNPVTDLGDCSSTCDSTDPVVYNGSNYTMGPGNGGIEALDATSGNITVIVDGDLTIDEVNVSVDGSTENTLTIVTTGDLILTDGYNIQVSQDEVPEKLIFHVPSDREVVFEGNGGDGYGIVYAPDALVSMSDMGDGTGSEWNGSVVGEVINARGVNSGAQVNFGGSVNVTQTEALDNLFITERRVGID